MGLSQPIFPSPSTSGRVKAGVRSFAISKRRIPIPAFPLEEGEGVVVSRAYPGTFRSGAQAGSARCMVLSRKGDRRASMPFLSFARC